MFSLAFTSCVNVWHSIIFCFWCCILVILTVNNIVFKAKKLLQTIDFKQENCMSIIFVLPLVWLLTSRKHQHLSHTISAANSFMWQWFWKIEIFWSKAGPVSGRPEFKVNMWLVKQKLRLRVVLSRH